MNVLVINSGSSTVKTRFIDTASNRLLGKGLVDRIGTAEAAIKWESDGDVFAEAVPGVTVEEGVDRLIDAAQRIRPIEAVGHRIVHGGEFFTQPTLIDDAVLEKIAYCAVFAPLHNPAHAAGIRASRAALPALPQVAVFDTAFHATMPRYAYHYAIPDEIYRQYGVRRYGAHGTSHQYLSKKANEYLEAKGVSRPFRVCTLHLGNGCSAAAVLDGICQDTSMGFTPLEGLVMGTRTGDIDPAVVPFLMDREGWTPARADRFLNKECGLLGVSNVSSDMRDVERARGEGDPAATLAFDLFCYRIKKYVGSYVSVLGGLDALVFSGGIGEHSKEVRRAVISGLGWLGLELNEAANDGPTKGTTPISPADRTPVALVIPTDEEGLIASQTAAVAAAAA